MTRSGAPISAMVPQSSSGRWSAPTCSPTPPSAGTQPGSPRWSRSSTVSSTCSSAHLPSQGKTIVPAVLIDRLQTPNVRQYKFVTSAKAGDTGIAYGTVLWGFETFHDKPGVTRIKNEYHSFRIPEGETAAEALRLFNEVERNPGSPTAPTK